MGSGDTGRDASLCSYFLPAGKQGRGWEKRSGQAVRDAVLSLSCGMWNLCSVALLSLPQVWGQGEEKANKGRVGARSDAGG